MIMDADITYQGKTYHPDLLPETADPIGSTRYGNVRIVLEQIENNKYETTYYNSIAENNTFIIEDKSPEYKGYECRFFKGTIVKEADGSYSWWKSIK